MAALVLAAIGFIGYMPFSSAAAPLTGATPEQPPAQKTEAARPSYTPPAENDIPDGPFGDMIRLGEAIFHDTQNNAKGFVGNDLQCSNCHLDRGRQSNAMPLGAAYLLYPAYRPKNGHVNTFQERPQDPRFVDSVAETRKRFHDEPTSKYGLVVNGVLLGEKSPPSGTINAAD